MTKTREEILAWQRALDEFRATPVGTAFYKFKYTLTRAATLDTEDSFNDRARASTRNAHEAADKAERALLALLGAPAILTGENNETV